MTPIVNVKYQYIVLYSAKSGCTSLRSLYLSVHEEELSEKQLSSLDWYHNLNEVQPFDPAADYSDYYVYSMTRNPYGRVVSAFLDQYVFARNPGVQAMINSFPPASEPNNFIEFLEYLESVPDLARDTHFQTQGYFSHADLVVTPALSLRYRLFGQKPENAFAINMVGDIGKFNQHTKTAFERIFRNDKAKKSEALKKLSLVKRNNSSFYGKAALPSAATLTLEQLTNMVFAPKPQDFYRDPLAIELVNKIYHSDFRLFGYKINKIPNKSASKEIDLIPDDFDWKMYLRLNPDLPHSGIDNERAVIRHYLEFGRFELVPRAYKIEAPKGFEWQRYLELNSDLKVDGIVSEEAAIEHYISYGIRQERRII